MEAIEAIGIKKIIWIDDDFAKSPTDKNQIIKSILEQVEATIDSTGIIPKLEVIALQLDENTPTAIILQELESRLLELELQKLVIILKNLDPEETEFSEEQIGLLAKFIQNSEVELLKLSLSDWKQKQAELIKSVDQETLFLIDKDFDKEPGGAADTGKDILKILLQEYEANVPPNFILFSHTCNGISDEEALRKELYSEFKVDLGKKNIENFNFQVLSKSAAIDANADVRLFECIRAIFIRKLFSKMAHGLKVWIIKGLDDITENLISTNIYSLDEALFGSSLREGVSELELLHRIYSLKQKSVVSKILQSEQGLVEELTKLRLLNANKSGGENKDIDSFLKIRKEEFWCWGEDINKTRSPIVCGDIFKYKEDEYILLSQPCDTMLRADGMRQTNIATLAPIKKKVTETKNQLNKKIDEYSGTDTYILRESDAEFSFWYITLNKTIHVNLDTLDLCCFNEGGEVKLELQQEEPSPLLLTGQVKKYQQMYELINNQSLFPSKICADNGINSSEEKIDDLFYVENYGWKSRLSRVRRLEANYSEHVLNKYFAYKSRKAFEHDFTRGR